MELHTLRFCAGTNVGRSRCITWVFRTYRVLCSDSVCMETQQRVTSFHNIRTNFKFLQRSRHAVCGARSTGWPMNQSVYVVEYNGLPTCDAGKKSQADNLGGLGRLGRRAKH